MLALSYNSSKKHFGVKQSSDDDNLQNLEASLEAFKELICLQQDHLRKSVHEQDILSCGYRALLVQSTSMCGEHPVRTLH
jgi:hypothetical protein